MYFSDIPFTKLRALLLDLHFIERVVDGKFHGFYHEESDTFFPLRLYRPQDKVSMADIGGVRFQLDWRGLLSRVAFDAALLKVSA